MNWDWGFLRLFFSFFFWCRKSVAKKSGDLGWVEGSCFIRWISCLVSEKTWENEWGWGILDLLVLGCFVSGEVCATRVLVSHGWKAGALLHHRRCLIKNPGCGILICFCTFSQRPIKFCCSCTDNLNSRFWFHGCFNFWNLVILCLNSGETEERERKRKQLCFYLYFNFFFSKKWTQFISAT